jgi:hypothetical protein
MFNRLSGKEKNRLEELIFQSLHSDPHSETGQKIEKEIADMQVSDDTLKDITASHYYLAPRNIRRAQIMLAFLTIIIAVALAAVRVSNDIVMLAFITGLGVLVGSPYIAFHFLMRELENLDKLSLLSYISFAYTSLAGLIFAIFCLVLQVSGIAIIPLVMIGLYFLELRKLTTLRQKLASLS